MLKVFPLTEVAQDPPAVLCGLPSAEEQGNLAKVVRHGMKSRQIAVLSVADDGAGIICRLDVRDSSGSAYCVRIETSVTQECALTAGCSIATRGVLSLRGAFYRYEVRTFML